MNKLLTELPCSVGDTVWCLVEEWNGNTVKTVIDCIEVDGFRFNSNTEVIAVTDVYGEEVLLPIFNTYNEARKELEKLKGECKQ